MQLDVAGITRAGIIHRHRVGKGMTDRWDNGRSALVDTEINQLWPGRFFNIDRPFIGIIVVVEN